MSCIDCFISYRIIKCKLALFIIIQKRLLLHLHGYFILKELNMNLFILWISTISLSLSLYLVFCDDLGPV